MSTPHPALALFHPSGAVHDLANLIGVDRGAPLAEAATLLRDGLASDGVACLRLLSSRSRSGSGLRRWEIAA